MIPLILKNLAFTFLLSVTVEHLAHKDGDNGYNPDLDNFEENQGPDNPDFEKGMFEGVPFPGEALPGIEDPDEAELRNIDVT